MARRDNPKSRLLRMARKRLGIVGSVKNKVVIAAAAARLGVPVPTGYGRYDLLAQVVNTLPIVKRVRAPKPDKPKPDFVNTLGFLESYEWRRLRMQVLVKRGARCECCGATPKDGVRIHVDHVKPRRLFPALALDETNLQVLCEVCNHGKGNWDQTDWRKSSEPDRPRLVKGIR